MPVSDCQPVIRNGKAVYYASNENMVDFYSVDTESGTVQKKAYRVAGENAAWNLYNGVLTISGSGALSVSAEENFRLPVSSASSAFVHYGSDNVWKAIRPFVKKIIVEKGITSISDEAFAYFENLEEVELNPGLLSIGEKAFYQCGSLEKIVIPSSVKSLGEDFLWTGYFWTSDSSHVVRATIYAPYDSYAVKYAKANGISYKSDLSEAKVSGLKSEYEYTGQKLKPKVTVTLGDTTLKSGKDYELTYKNNTKAGTASVEITGAGNYFGSITRTFLIVDPKSSGGNGNTVSGWSADKGFPAYGKSADKGTVFKEIKTGIQYRVTKKSNSGGASVEYKTGPLNVSNVSIPASIRINGVTYKVTSIAARAFFGNQEIRKVTIGKNVASIGKQAFCSCKNLKSIIIKTSALTSSKVGAKAFKDIYKKAVVTVPAKKLKTYKAILKKKGIGSKVSVKKGV